MRLRVFLGGGLRASYFVYHESMMLSLWSLEFDWPSVIVIKILLLVRSEFAAPAT